LAIAARGYRVDDMTPERIVIVRPRTVLMVAGLLICVAALVQVVLVSERVLIWVLISLFLAMALNPAVDWLQRHGVRRRGAATALVFAGVSGVILGIAALIIPTLIQQVQDFVDALPGYVRDLTHGRGPLGFLETKYHVVEHVRDAVRGNGTGSLTGGANAALSLTQSIATFVAGLVTITFLTIFMLLEGPAWKTRIIALLPADSQPRWERIAQSIYRTVGGYVNGNLLISLIAGTATAVVLLSLGVPYALALGLIVAILDLIPLVGATLAAVIVTLVALADSVTSAIIVLAFFIVYQQLENHLLQPIVYGRTVRLSPLAILIAVLIGGEVAGIIGALCAIPVAGTIQILINEYLEYRRGRPAGTEEAPSDELERVALQPPERPDEPDRTDDAEPPTGTRPPTEAEPRAARRPLLRRLVRARSSND
jgi:predicted PurR-regulated permease PerM